jgi:hypothetical protein
VKVRDFLLPLVQGLADPSLNHSSNFVEVCGLRGPEGGRDWEEGLKVQSELFEH